MKNSIKIVDRRFSKKTTDLQNEYPGYPQYPAADDLYNKGIKESDLDPEDVSKNKSTIDTASTAWNEKNFEEDPTGDDLDVPGAEQDEQIVNSESEDEENKYYSLGGDDHTDLDESNGKF